MCCGTIERPRGNLLIEKSQIARGQNIFARCPQEPERQIACIIRDHRRDYAMAGHAVWDRSIVPNFLQRVAQNALYNIGVAEDEGQGMLKRIARCALESHGVLIEAVLIEDVLLEEIVISETAAQVIVIPFRLARDPGLVGHGESHALGLPGCARSFQRRERGGLMTRDQRVQLESGRQISIEEIERLRFAGIEMELALKQHCALRVLGSELIIEVAAQSGRMLHAACAEERFSIDGVAVGGAIERDEKSRGRMKIVKISLGRWLLNRADEVVCISSEHNLHALPEGFFFRRAAWKLLGLQQADVPI